MKTFLALFGVAVAAYALAGVVEEVRLSEFKSTDALTEQAVQASARSLTDRGYDPSEFYVQIHDIGRTIEVTLIHQGDLDSIVPGGGNGKSQICEYQKEMKRLAKCLYFQ